MNKLCYIFFLLLICNFSYGQSTNDIKEYNYCDGCIMIIDTIKYYLNQNYTINEIERIINIGCGYLGPGYSMICDYVVDYGIKFIIKYIQNLDSKQTCEYIYICNSKTRDIKCSYCKFIISELINYINNNHNIDEIKKFIISICNNTTYKYSNVCINILNYELDEFIEFLKLANNPEYICKFIQLC